MSATITNINSRVSLVEYWFLYQYDWNRAVEEAERRNASG